MLDPVIPSSLVDLFETNCNVTFVDVGIASTLKLETEYRIGGNACWVDLGATAGVRYVQPELRNATLRELANIVVGRDFWKPLVETMCTEWDAVQLTDEQVLYASIDPFVSSEIAKILI